MSQGADGSPSLEQQLDELGALIESNPGPAAAREAGEWGEAVSVGFTETLTDGHVFEQHTPGSRPQGIDSMFLGDDGTPHVVEDKTIAWGEYHPPQMSSTVDGRQMDASWISRNSSETQLPVEVDQVGGNDGGLATEARLIDIPGDALARFELDDGGRRLSADPFEVYSLSDVVSVIDGTNFLHPGESGSVLDEGEADPPVGEVGR